MELTGEQILELPRERVWAALNDPEILRVCVPGCESLERVEENQFKVVMAAAVGPIKARFTGKLILTDLRAPESYSLTFEGSGGAAGFGKGGAQVNLDTEGDNTRLLYRAHVQVGGKLAQVGARLIDGVAKRLAGEFFAHFTEAVTEPGETRTEVTQQSTPTETEPSAAQAPQAVKKGAAGGGRLWLWAVGLVMVIAAAALHGIH
jgi:carbon monoxide dehydrogenase subunit G